MCLAKTWRPLADVAAATCPGCGRQDSRPFNESSLTFRFRLAEPLRRAIENDSIYHLLVMRCLMDLMSIRDDWLVGAHPGIDVYTGDEQIGEADVLLLFSDGTTLPVEVKRHASGFRSGDLQRLDQIANRMSAIGTVLACGDDSAAAGQQFAGFEHDGPMPRRLITADEWLAPYAHTAIGAGGPGRSQDENAAVAFDERFGTEFITARPGVKNRADPVANYLLP